MKSIILMIFVSAFVCSTLAAQNIDESNHIKVLSFNIYHGETMNGDFDLDVIATVIQKSNPDFVAMQEVDFKTNRAKKMDLTTELAYRTQMAPLFGKAMTYDGGEYGEGLLTAHTIISTRNIPLPYTQGNEPRSALEIVTVLPGGDTIAIVGTHLDHLENEKDRVAQAKEINEVFANSPYPTILMGDLNATPNSTPIQILKKMWTVTDAKKDPEPTYPSENPTQKIDYVMYYPQERWKVVEYRTICDTIASDHCAFEVVLELVPQK